MHLLHQNVQRTTRTERTLEQRERRQQTMCSLWSGFPVTSLFRASPEHSASGRQSDSVYAVRATVCQVERISPAPKHCALDIRMHWLQFVLLQRVSFFVIYSEFSAFFIFAVICRPDMAQHECANNQSAYMQILLRHKQRDGYCPPTCDLCERQFSTFSNLAHHIRRRHSRNNSLQSWHD